MAVLDRAGENELSFLGSDAHLNEFAATRAAAVIVQKRVRLAGCRYEARAGVTGGRRGPGAGGGSGTFCPADSAAAGGHRRQRPRGRGGPKIDATAAVGPHVTIGSGLRPGGQRPACGVYIGDYTVGVGETCELFPNVVVRDASRWGIA